MNRLSDNHTRNTVSSAGKAPLSLIEQLIMLLVFAVAAAICLRVFAYADNVSRQDANKSRAMLAAQSYAEVLKATGGSMNSTADRLCGTLQEDGSMVALYSESFQPVCEGQTAAFRLTVTPVPSGSAALGCATITITQEGAAPEEILCMDTCWQVPCGQEVSHAG